MCGWIQLISEHIVAHHSELYEDLSHTTISTVPHALIETVAPPSFESLSRLSSATFIAHAGNPMHTRRGLGSAQSEQCFTSNPFQAEVPECYESWSDYRDAKILSLTSASIAGTFTKDYKSMQCIASLATEVFDQYIIIWLSVVAAWFEHKIDSMNKNEDWKWSLLDFCFRNIFDDAQKLTNILKADIQFTMQTGLNEIKTQLLSLMGEFQQKLLDEATALDPSQLQMFTCGLCDCNRGASSLRHCQVRQLDEPAKDSFFRGGLTPCIHNALTKFLLHGEVVYPELHMDLEKAIQDNAGTVFGKIRQSIPADTFSRAIPTAHGNGQLVTSSAAGILKEEHPAGTSFGIVKETLVDDGEVISGITACSQVPGDQKMVG